MKRILLDTHTFLWWVGNAPELSEAARQVISNTSNDCFLSVASCWEIAIKSSLGKLQLSCGVDQFVTDQLALNGFRLLNIELRHAAKVEHLPFHHRDPFDRLLIVQAITEKLTIVSADCMFDRYDVQLIW